MKRYSFILLFLALVLTGRAESFPRNTDAGIKPSGTIKVKVFKNINGKRELHSGAKVNLVVYEASDAHQHPVEKTSLTGKADGNAEAVFRNVKTSASFFYQATSEYMGKTFASAVMTFTDSDQIEGSIDLFEITNSDEAVKIVQKHVICKRTKGDSGDRLSFTEFIIIVNDSDKAFFPDKDKMIKISVPGGAENLNFSFGVSPSDVSYKDGQNYFLVNLPLLPGHSNMANIGYGYEVKFPGKFSYTEISTYPVESAVWLMSDEDIKVEGAKVASHGSKSMGESTFYQYKIKSLGKGEGLDLTVSEDIGLPSMSNMVVIALIAGIILFAIFASFKWRKKSEGS